MEVTEKQQQSAGSSKSLTEPTDSSSHPPPGSDDTFNFDFYIGFTKPLILNLLDPKGKVANQPSVVRCSIHQHHSFCRKDNCRSMGEQAQKRFCI